MKLGLWISIVANIVFAGVCAYQAGVIQHLQFVISLLASSSPN